jgi:hypothetical protein
VELSRRVLHCFCFAAIITIVIITVIIVTIGR